MVKIGTAKSIDIYFKTKNGRLKTQILHLKIVFIDLATPNFITFRLGLQSGKVVTKKFANLETCVEIGK